MPELGAAEMFVSILSEVGEGKSGSSGLQPIGWADIFAWRRVTGSEITPGEAVVIKHLSTCYVAQYYKSQSPDCPAPHVESLPNRDVVADRLKLLFGMLRK